MTVIEWSARGAVREVPADGRAAIVEAHDAEREAHGDGRAGEADLEGYLS